MNFKFFNDDKEYSFLRLEPMQQLTLTRFNPENVEFCFQFGDNEPIVFATGPNECSIRLTPQANSNITFTDNDKVFKLFAREIQND
jgi:hypothetical protein